MERRFVLLAGVLLVGCVALASCLAFVVYRDLDVTETGGGVEETTAGAFTAAVNGNADTCTGKSCSNFCMTKGCVQTASDILDNMDASVDPCVDFYQFACGGFMERTSIPDDRTRMSSFSVLGDELLTQVRCFGC